MTDDQGQDAVNEPAGPRLRSSDDLADWYSAARSVLGDQDDRLARVTPDGLAVKVGDKHRSPPQLGSLKCSPKTTAICAKPMNKKSLPYDLVPHEIVFLILAGGSRTIGIKLRMQKAKRHGIFHG